MNENILAGYEIHPVAAIFPVLPDDELQDLADSIRINGQQQPIVRDAEGVIIDGRNRLLACVRAGVEPRFTDLPPGADPVAFILDANVQRRHMTAGQRAMALAKAQTFSSGKFQRKGEAAKSMGLSGAHLSRAIAVIDHAPELADPVLAGDASLNDAYAIARGHKLNAEHERDTARDPETNRVMFRIPPTLEEAEAAIEKALEDHKVIRQYLEAFRRVYHVTDDSELGQRIAKAEHIFDDDEEEEARAVKWPKAAAS